MNAIPREALLPAARRPGAEALDRALVVAGSASEPGAVTVALLEYWRALGTLPLPARATVACSLGRRVAAGEVPARSLLAVLLGETDTVLLIAATRDYVEGRRLADDDALAAPADACDWIRRGLPLNRAAIFAGLLSFDDADVDELLRVLRPRLSDREAALAGPGIARLLDTAAAAA